MQVLDFSIRTSATLSFFPDPPARIPARIAGINFPRFVSRIQCLHNSQDRATYDFSGQHLPEYSHGANLVSGGGTTFRAWAPLASAVYISGTFGSVAMTGQTDNLLLARDANGYWTGFVAIART